MLAAHLNELGLGGSSAGSSGAPYPGGRANGKAPLPDPPSSSNPSGRGRESAAASAAAAAAAAQQSDSDNEDEPAARRNDGTLLASDPPKPL